MTIAIGTDIVEIERISNAFKRQGDRLINRVLTSAEQDRLRQFSNEDQQIAYLAKRWCAKEAIAKALGTGIAKGVGFQQIEISNSDSGAPVALLTEGALDRLTAIGGKKVLISLSDERQYAVAYCTII